MLKDYVYGPIMPPYICCDGRFAEKYGIVEAIIFNYLYHDFVTTSQMKRYGGWHQEDGWMEADGHMWRCCSETNLFGCFTGIFNEQQHRDAINHLCNERLLHLRPSLTDGYYWISIGEELNSQEMK